MFKAGDRVICINNIDSHGIEDNYIKKGKIYTFEYYRRVRYPSPALNKDRHLYEQISLAEDLVSFHNEKLFITLKEHRKLKLKEICLKSEIE